jgi:hypothetical protein
MMIDVLALIMTVAAVLFVPIARTFRNDTRRAAA